MSGSFGGSADKSKTSEAQQSDLPPWLKEAYQNNLQRAQGIAGQGAAPYGGPFAAADNSFLDMGRDRALQASDMGQGQIGAATNIYNDVANASANAALAGVERASAGSLAGADLSPYMNPYQSAVIDQSNGEIDRQRQIMQGQNAYAASQAGAFGGSRHGIVDAENNRNFAQLEQQNTNGLLNAGYDRATGLATSDIDRAAATSQFNANSANMTAGQNADRINAAEQAAMGYRLSAAQGLLGAGQQQQQQYLTGASALTSAGQGLQQQEQTQLEGAYQDFLRQQDDPFKRQQLLNSALFGIEQGGLTTQTTNGSSSAAKIGGGVGSK